MKIIDYAIIVGANTGQLTGFVKRFIENGWQPIGCPVLNQVPDSSVVEWHQAMVKYENPPA